MNKADSESPKNKVLKIVQYYPWIYLTSGVERTILELASRSRHQHTIITNHFDHHATYPELSQMNVQQLTPVSVKRSLLAVFHSCLTIGLQKLDLTDCDLLIIHCDGVGDFTLLRNTGVPVICYCHTPLRVVFDDHYYARTQIKYASLLKRAALESARWAFRLVDRFVWKKYDYILFNSSETQQRAISGGLLDRQQNEILHPGFDWYKHQPIDQYDKYFLVPGRIMWTKNIELAINAFKHFSNLKDQNQDFKLIITGRVDEKSKPYLEILKLISGLREDIEFIINPTDDKLWSLYDRAYSILYPPFNEDWGMVPIEANAFAKPVIATNCGGPLESQIHKKTGFLVAPTIEGFADAMHTLAKDENLVRKIGKKARSHSMQYDWQKFITRFDEIADSLIPR